MTDGIEYLQVGEFKISKRENGYWIQHASGEGMETTAEKFEALIREFYKREF